MKRITAATLALMSLTACPDGVIDSVDGLKGGTIAGDSVVDGSLDVAADLTAISMSVETLEAGEVTVSGILRVSTEAEVQRLVATSAQLSSVNFQDAPTLKGRGVLPALVGVADRANTRGAAAAEASCSDAFAGSHICREHEFELALRFYDGDLGRLDGVSLQVAPRVAAELVQSVDGVDVRSPFVIDNCQDWDALGDIAGAIFPTARRNLVVGVDVVDGFSGRAILRVDGSRVLTEYSPECAQDTVEFACCL